MAISSYMGIQTALRGLLAAQEAIDTTGHNIANANTPGYSRQSADMTESPALTIPAYSNVTGGGVQVGTGVDITTINRIRNQFLDIQYRAQNTTSNDASTRSSILDQVQTGLAEPSDHGLASQLSAFWNAWSDVANSPQSAAARQTLVDDATALTKTFNAIDSQLSTIQSQASEQYNAITGYDPATGLTSPSQVQSDADQIAALNGQISQALAAKQNPNDLMDKRDQLLDDLSSLGTVSVKDPGNGLLQVTFGGMTTTDPKVPTQLLVDGTTTPSTTSPPSWASYWSGQTKPAGGELGALLSLSGAGGQIDTYRTTLNTVATDLMTSVNNAYTTTPAGLPFFIDDPAKTPAGSIAVNPPLIADPTKLQTSTTANPGANDVALAIAGLRGGQADQTYAAFISQVGSDVQSIQSTQQTSQAVLASIDNQRKSVSGVSLDEEMANLTLFQRGYQASARVLTTMDGMLDTLINHTGTVGL